jgi:hypothetical protein
MPQHGENNERTIEKGFPEECSISIDHDHHQDLLGYTVATLCQSKLTMKRAGTTKDVCSTE